MESLSEVGQSVSWPSARRRRFEGVSRSCWASMCALAVAQARGGSGTGIAAWFRRAASTGLASLHAMWWGAGGVHSQEALRALGVPQAAESGSRITAQLGQAVFIGCGALSWMGVSQRATLLLVYFLLSEALRFSACVRVICGLRMRPRAQSLQDRHA
eukprot:5343198-Prymnesium_polylepis.1